jgi:hypothetical protein
MQIKRCVVTVAGACVWAGLFLAGRASAQGTTRSWSIAETPLLSIGVAAGDSTQELHGVESGLRLPNGDLVIADVGNSRLRWFSAAGQHIRSVGRRGQGPEEFSRYMVALAGAGDTVLVHDPFGKRMHYFTANGEFVRRETGVLTDRAHTVYDRSVIMPLPATADARRVRAALVKVPPRSDALLRVVRVDDLGNLWIRSANAPQEFSIHDGEGRWLGMLSAPRHFEVLQAYDTLVLGRFRDADDIESIQLRRLWRGVSADRDRGTGTGRPAYEPAEAVAAAQSVISPMRAAGRMIVTRQEEYSARHKRYASSLDSLGVQKHDPKTGVTSSLITINDQSYWLISEHASTRIICIQAIGTGVPLGYFAACG